MSVREPQPSPASRWNPFSYIQAHWRGELALATSLWVNMLGGLVLVSWIELAGLPYLTANPDYLVRLTLLSLLFTRLVVYPWQLVGLLRCIDNDFIEHADILKTRALQAFALLTVLFTLVYSLELVQGAVFYREQLHVYTRDEAPEDYQLELSQDGKLLMLKGALEIGITDTVRLFLRESPRVRAVVLESGGGQIYEGRGLARLFSRLGLDTYVYAECSSACATAYIGGRKRYLGTGGKLGFHQYRADTSEHGRFVPFYDLEAEQVRDLALFESRGIHQAFRDKMFMQPAAGIWFPDHATLLEARVVHQIVQ